MCVQRKVGIIQSPGDAALIVSSHLGHLVIRPAILQMTEK